MLGKLPVPERPTILGVVGWCEGAGVASSAGASYTLDYIVGQGPTAHAVGAATAGGG